MKKLLIHQLGPWCNWCPRKTVRAVFGQWPYDRNQARKHCCEAHKGKLNLWQINNPVEVLNG